MTFRYGSKTIEIATDTKNKSTTPSCTSVFISRQQFSKAAKNGEIFAVHLNTLEETVATTKTPEVKKILKDYKDIFPKDLPDLPPE